MLRRRLGNDKVVEMPPKMGAEDFSEYGKAGVPAMMFFVGAVNRAKYQEAKASGTRLPSLYSSLFAPEVKPTLEMAMEAETAGDAGSAGGNRKADSSRAQARSE